MADTTRVGRSVPFIAGAVGVAGGGAVLVGWMFHIRTLTQPILAVPSMKVNTAIAIVAGGAATWCLASRRFVAAARMLAWLVTAVGLAALSQDIVGWDLGIDQWLFADVTALNGFHPGRMSPLTAFCFVAIGLALTLSAKPGRAWTAQGLALAAGIVPLMSLASFALGLHALYGISSYRAMAIHTAILLLALAVGVLFLDRRAGLTGLLFGDTIGATATRRILPPIIIIPILVERIRLWGQQHGFIDLGLGVALFVISTVVLLSVIVVLAAKLMDEAEAKRRHAEEALRQSHETLESRVAEKTEEARQNEERLRAGQRMEAMGRLAGGVAHDFNNMMTVVSGYSELLLGRVGADDPARKALQEIKKAGDRCAALTRHLLAFSRRQMLTPSVVDLNAIVSDLCAMLPVLLGENIEVVNHASPDLWRVRADQSQLEQVIVNLAVNARDAMPRGGTLRIETSNVELDDRSMPGRPEIAPGSYVRLAISDSGHGMDAATAARVFDPFFTTKPVGQGTGLGLSTVYGVVKQSGGYIYVESEPDRGAAFHIYLPKVEAAVVAPSVIGQAPAVVDGRETVLLVEDETAVRLLLGAVLEDAGYRVIGAGDGYQALRISEQFQERIHLIVTDVVMPGMSGGELVERLRPMRPNMRILLISGYTQNVVLEHAITQPGTAFLQKPFTPDALLTRVRDVLTGTAP